MPRPGPAPARRAERLLAPLLVLVLLAACGTQAPNAPARSAATVSPNLVATLAPVPPVLPGPDAPRPLPDARERGPVVPEARLEPLSVSTSRVELTSLVIAATEHDPALAAWEALLQQAGLPYDVLIAVDEPLEVDRLVGPDDVGRYQAILLATGNLAYLDGDAYAYAFDDAEWTLLHQYARDYGVRQVVLYAYPGSYPEPYGIEPIDEVAPGMNAPEAYAAIPTATGRSDVFPYLVDGAEVPIRPTGHVYVYRSRLSDGSVAEPILVDPDGHVLGVVSTAPDGRERLVLTFDQAAYGGTPLMHTQLLGQGLLRWATRGVYLGQRRYHFDADVDDWFIPTALWDVEAADFADEPFHLSGADASSFAAQLAELHADHPFADGFTWAMAYNGLGAEPEAPSSCDPAASLSSVTKCVATDFRWVNHTWSHAYMDRNPPAYDIDYAAIHQEIDANDALVEAFGFGPTFAPGSLITGDLSGLGWHAPDGPDTGPKVDFGLEASNPDLLAAAADLGRRYVASNMSTPSHEPDCPGCGIVHPLDDRIFLVPRWPTNVFAAVATPEAATQAYNLVYGPDGIDPYFDEDLDYATYLEVETTIALAHVLSGAAYPHYFHVANLYEYAPGRSLLRDYADALFERYGALVDLPLLSNDWDALGDFVSERTEHAGAGASGVWDRDAGTLTVHAAHGGTVFLTGAAFPGDAPFAYGPDTISKRDFAPGETVTLDAPGADRPEPILHPLTVTVAGSGLGMVVGDTGALACTGGACTAAVAEDVPLVLTAVPLAGSRFSGWSGACSGTSLCTVSPSAPTSVRATFDLAD